MKVDKQLLDNALAEIRRLESEIETLKAENSGLREGLKNWEKMYDKLKQQFIEYKNNRRFEAAKAAMQGLLASGWNVHDLETGVFATRHADALLKALEESK